MKTTGLLIVLLCVSGCAITLADLRAYPTAPVASFPGDKNTVTLCVSDGLDNHPDTSRFLYKVVTRPGGPNSIVGYQQMPSGPFVFTPSPFLELLIDTRLPSQIAVDERHYLGYGGALLPAVRQIAEACAAPSPDAGTAR